MVVELHPEDLEEKSLAGFMAVPVCSGRAESVGHDVLPGSLGRTELAAGKLSADGSRATDGRFRERAFELRPAREFVCSRTGVLVFAFLDAEVRHGTAGRGFRRFGKAPVVS